jgi:thiamine kinase-like enzyme
MPRTPIFLSDLCLLRDLFAPGLRLVVIDPFERLTGVIHNNFDFINQFKGHQEVLFADLSHNNMHGIVIGTNVNDNISPFAYINNPDGTMRWIFPADESSTSFLSLYNSASLKAKLYTMITQMAWHLGQGNRLASGIVRVQQKLLNQVKHHCSITKSEDISIFTGTRGETRKVVLEIHEGNKTIGFIKIPITKVSTALVTNEIEMLKELNKYDFTTLSLPTVSKKIQGHARISNIKPSIIISADRITAIHIRAMADLYAISHESKSIESSNAWKTIQDNLEWLKRDLLLTSGLDPKKINSLVKLLRKLYNATPISEKISLSVSHGDFTPWNMYCNEQRLFVYDWEMARNGIPMFFDLFHFTYQSCILQQRKNYNAVNESINLWKQQPLAQQLTQKYNINLVLHEQLYLLFTVSHYVRQYIGEKELLIQSQWMIDTWTLAIEHSLERMKNPTKLQ